jgi:hypothetical protein
VNDTELSQRWSMLEPNGYQRARIEQRTLEWLDASETSLLVEWLDLVRVDPLAGVGFTALGALSLLMATPLGWAVVSFLR